MKHTACGLVMVCALVTGVQAETLRQECLLQPSRTIELAGAAPGIIRKVHVDRGDPVRKGQVLLELDGRLETAAIDRAQSDQSFARRKLERTTVLYQRKLMSDEERDTLLQEEKRAELDEQEARIRLEMKQIVSPVNGKVLERNAEPGELLGSEPVLVLVQLDPLYAESVLPGAWYGRIAKGDSVVIEPGEGYEPVTARVDVVDPVIDGQSGTFRVRMRVANKHEQLTAGLRCTAVFNIN